MNAKTNQKPATPEKTVAPGGIELSRKEIDGARHEGALEAYKEGAKSAAIADTGTTGDPEAMAEAANLRVAPDLNSTFLAPLLDLPLDTLVKRLSNEKVADFIDFEDAKGLLHLERSGRNRSEWVKALCARLGVKDPREVTSAGPAYTNATEAVDQLD